MGAMDSLRWFWSGIRFFSRFVDFDLRVDGPPASADVCAMTHKRQDGAGVLLEEGAGGGVGGGFGILCFAQDDGKDKQRQPQIPSLRCGMTNKKTDNG
jgi:hypothetical protein